MGGLPLRAFGQDAASETGNWGFDLSGAELATKPGDDFFRYCNGAWYDRTVIAPDRDANGIDRVLEDRIEAQVREVLERGEEGVEASSRADAAKIHRLYVNFMDESRADALDLRPAFERVTSEAQKNIELFRPFIFDNKYVFRADHIRALRDRFTADDQNRLRWGPEALDWYDYWMNIHFPGLQRGVLPERDETYAARLTSTSMLGQWRLDFLISRKGNRVAVVAMGGLKEPPPPLAAPLMNLVVARL